MNGKVQKSLMDATRNDLLTGEELNDLPAHTSGCPEDLRTLQAGLRSYRTVALTWAERRSAAQPSLAAAARRSRIWAAVPQWSLAAVAALTVAAGVVHFHGNQGDDSLPVAHATVAARAADVTASPDEQIAADNNLLSNIDAALRYDSASSAAQFGLKVAPQPARSGAHSQVTD